MNSLEQQSKLYSCKIDELFEHLKTRPQGLTNKEAEKRPKFEFPRENKNFAFIPRICFSLLLCLVLALIFRVRLNALILLVAFIADLALSVIESFIISKCIRNIGIFGKSQVTVLRENKPHFLGWDEVVVGDVVELEGGDMVLSDIRLFDGESILVEETYAKSRLVEKTPAVAPQKDNSHIVFAKSRIIKGLARGVILSMPVKPAPGTEIKRNAMENFAELRSQGYAIFSFGILLFLALFIGYHHEIAIPYLFLFTSLPYHSLFLLSLIFAGRVQEKTRFFLKSLGFIKGIANARILIFPDRDIFRGERKTIRQVFVNGELVFINGNKIRKDGEFPGHSTQESIGLLAKIGVLLGESYFDKTFFKFDRAQVEFGKIFGITYENLIGQEFEFLMPDKIPGLKGGFFATSSSENIFLVFGEPHIILENSDFHFCNSSVVPLSKNDRENINFEIERMEEEGLCSIGYAYKFVEGPSTEQGHLKGLIFVGVCGFEDIFDENIREIRKEFEAHEIAPVILAWGEKEKIQARLKKIGWINSSREVIAFDDLVEGEIKSESFLRFRAILNPELTELKRILNELFPGKLIVVNSLRDYSELESPRYTRIAPVGASYEVKQRSDILAGVSGFSNLLALFKESLRLFNWIKRTDLLISWILGGEAIYFVGCYFILGGQAFKEMNSLVLLILNLIILPLLSFLSYPPSRPSKPLNYFLLKLWGIFFAGLLSLFVAFLFRNSQLPLGEFIGMLFWVLACCSVVALSTIEERVFAFKPFDNFRAFVSGMILIGLAFCIIYIPPLRIRLGLQQFSAIHFLLLILFGFIFFVFVEIGKMFSKGRRRYAIRET